MVCADAALAENQTLANVKTKIVNLFLFDTNVRVVISRNMNFLQSLGYKLVGVYVSNAMGEPSAKNTGREKKQNPLVPPQRQFFMPPRLP